MTSSAHPAVRIAMWSGPRNISTAMMRSFENRSDCVVVDEPFYAAFLSLSGIDHPMREAIIADGEPRWASVVARLSGPISEARVLYQKHMTHHMLPSMDRSWIPGMTNAFLIRSPERVAASYAKKRDAMTLEDIGFVQQAEIFNLVSDVAGQAPPVIDADDVLSNPRGMLTALCAACGIAFEEAMLTWSAGRRASDGIWASHWYGSVEKSTGFEGAPGEPPTLSDEARRIADVARPYYERLWPHRLAPA